VTTLSTLYNCAGVPQALVVAILPGAPGPTGPTGQACVGGAGIRHGHWRGGAIRLRFAAGNDQHVERRHDRGDAVHRHRPCDLHGIDRRRRQPLCRRCPRTAKINVFNNTFDPISVSGAFKDPAAGGLRSVHPEHQRKLYVTYFVRCSRAATSRCSTRTAISCSTSATPT